MSASTALEPADASLLTCITAIIRPVGAAGASLRAPQSDAPALLSVPYSMLAGASVARALSARRLLHFTQMKAAALRDGNL